MALAQGVGVLVGLNERGVLAGDAGQSDGPTQVGTMPVAPRREWLGSIRWRIRGDGIMGCRSRLPLERVSVVLGTREGRTARLSAVLIGSCLSSGGWPATAATCEDPKPRLVSSPGWALVLAGTEEKAAPRIGRYRLPLDAKKSSCGCGRRHVGRTFALC
jgi:hypothetical protein